MFTVRKSDERGGADHGWLQTRHTFSFADYVDPNHHHFHSLRVINEDTVQPGKGFGTHPHRDMEIISYILEGEIEHKDSMGHTKRIKAGEVQTMTAGTGVTHSEYNASSTEVLRLLQIWIFPNQKNLPPGYDQKAFSPKPGLQLLVSESAKDGSLKIHQDIELYAGHLNETTLEKTLAPGRSGWIQMIEGQVEVQGHSLEPGDGLAIEGVETVSIKSAGKSHFLFFDLI